MQVRRVNSKSYRKFQRYLVEKGFWEALVLCYRCGRATQFEVGVPDGKTAWEEYTCHIECVE